MATSTSPSEAQSRETSAFEPPTYRIFYDSDQTLRWGPPPGSKELGEALSWKYPELDGLKEKMKAAMEEFLRAERKKTSKMRRVLNSGKRVLDKMTPSSKPRESCPNLTSHEDQINAEKVDEDSTKHQVDVSKIINSTDSTAELNGISMARGRDPFDSIGTPKEHLAVSGVEKDPQSLSPLIKKTEGNERSGSSMHFFNWNPTNNDFRSTTKKRARSRYDEDRRKKVAQNRGHACEEHRRRRVTVSTTGITAFISV
jgi:hypothetical protein